MSADITKPETWYGLWLGEIVWFTENSNLQRVPGGWMMYTVNNSCRGDVETFIPFNNEFKEQK